MAKDLKTSLPETTMDAQQAITNCVAMLSTSLVSVREVRSGKLSASVINTSAEASGTASSTIAGSSLKDGSEYLNIFIKYSVIIKIFHFIVLISLRGLVRITYNELF